MATGDAWNTALEKAYGSRVEDLLEGTGLEVWGETLRFGIRIVRGAMSPSESKVLMDELGENLEKTDRDSNRDNRRGVTVQGDVGPWYETLQW